MNPTHAANTTTHSARATLKRAKTHQEAVSRLQPPKRWRSEADTLNLSNPSVSLGTLRRLAPEVRNTIYSLLLHSDDALITTPSVETAGRFKLRERSSESQLAIVKALQNLSVVSTGVRREARTYFYAANRFTICDNRYENLPVFLRWLEGIGPECRAVLRSVNLHGYMWYQPSLQLTKRFHELLRECTNARVVDLTISLRHYCEASLPELNAYMNYMGPEPHDGPMPEVDVADWAQTIVRMPKLTKFDLYLVLGADRERIRMGMERSLGGLSGDRAHVLAANVQRRLGAAVRELSGRSVAVQVRYRGEYEDRYYVAWAGAVHAECRLSHNR
jgi:hypothetical protein